MKLKEYISNPCELRYMVDNLVVHTPYSLRMLMEKELCCNISSLKENYRKLEHLEHINGNSRIFGYLCCVKDIENSIHNLALGKVLAETELFEIKNFAYVVSEIRNYLVESNNIELFEIHDLTQVFNLLDPDGNRVTSFYIYSSYSSQLARLRNDFKTVQTEIYDLEINNEIGCRESKLHELKEKEGRLVALIEEESELVRRDLSGKIKQYYDVLLETFIAVGELDIMLAKQLQISEFGLQFPTFSKDGKTVIKGLFNPFIKNILNNKKKEYQPVDICFDNETVCITGANMGGKTVTIRTIGLVQILFQFGFGVPAASAVMDIKDEIMFSIEEKQSIGDGLSSFAAEMLGINKIINNILEGRRILALIDEPARTTNPVEGSALVASLIELLKGCYSSVLITTHYDVEDESIKRYRVKGLVDGRMNYELLETKKGDVPMEALTIARSIGIDDRWIVLAENYLKTHIYNN